MTDMKTEYYFSKNAIILASFFLLVILFFFAFVTYIFYSADLKIAMFICFFIFLLFLTTFPGFFQRIKFFLADIPALILTNDELIDNINLQIFKWADIKNISSDSIKIKTRVSHIAISLIDSDKYIDSIGNPFKRLIARLNHKYFGGAFSIQPNIIKCENAELLETLTNYFNEHATIISNIDK
jgi:hypothetical protein